MNIKKMSKDELELLSYQDIAYELLKTSKKKMTTPKLFKEVCDLLEISEDNMMDMIGDFYTTLMTDKRFILLDSSEWDLKEKHIVKPVVDDEEEIEEEEEEEEVTEETEDEAVITKSEDYDDIDDDVDDLDDLAIVTEEEMDEE